METHYRYKKSQTYKQIMPSSYQYSIDARGLVRISFITQELGISDIKEAQKTKKKGKKGERPFIIDNILQCEVLMTIQEFVNYSHLINRIHYWIIRSIKTKELEDAKKEDKKTIEDEEVPCHYCSKMTKISDAKCPHCKGDLKIGPEVKLITKHDNNDISYSGG